MSARPQADWRELEALYAPELREVTASPLVIVGTGDKTVAIGAGWKPPLPGQMSDEAITVQGWLLPPSKSLEPLTVRVWDWCIYTIAVGLLLGFAARWL